MGVLLINVFWFNGAITKHISHHNFIKTALFKCVVNRCLKTNFRRSLKSIWMLNTQDTHEPSRAVGSVRAAWYMRDRIQSGAGCRGQWRGSKEISFRGSPPAQRRAAGGHLLKLFEKPQHLLVLTTLLSPLQFIPRFILHSSFVVGIDRIIGKPFDLLSFVAVFQCCSMWLTVCRLL